MKTRFPDQARTQVTALAIGCMGMSEFCREAEAANHLPVEGGLSRLTADQGMTNTQAALVSCLTSILMSCQSAEPGA